MLSLHLSPHICKMAATAPMITSLQDSIPIKKAGRQEERTHTQKNPSLHVTLSSVGKSFPEVPSRLCIISQRPDLCYMSALVQLWVKEQEASIMIHPWGWVNRSPELLFGRQPTVLATTK